MLHLKLQELKSSLDIAAALQIVFCSFIGLSVQFNNGGRTSGRIIILFICITGSVVYWSYCAGLVSLLAVEKYDFPVKTVAVSL